MTIEQCIERVGSRLRLVSETLNARRESPVAIDLERAVEGIEQLVEDCLVDINDAGKADA